MSLIILSTIASSVRPAAPPPPSTYTDGFIAMPADFPDPDIWFSPRFVEVDGSNNVTKLLNQGTLGATHDATPDTANLANVATDPTWGDELVLNIPFTSTGGYDFGSLALARTVVTITTYKDGVDALFDNFDAFVSGSSTSSNSEIELIGTNNAADLYGDGGTRRYFADGAFISPGAAVLPMTKKTLAVTETKSVSNAGKLWRDNFDAGRNWKGVSGDVLIFTTLLTDAQIASLSTTLLNFYS